MKNILIIICLLFSINGFSQVTKVPTTLSGSDTVEFEYDGSIGKWSRVIL